MRISILASSEKQMDALKTGILDALQSVSETTRIPPPPLEGGLQAVFGSVTTPSEKTPIPKVKMERDPLPSIEPPEFTIEGTIYTETVVLSGIPKHITHSDMKSALQSISLVLTDDNEVMDLDMASVKYGKAFATQQYCEMTGESFEDLYEEFPSLKEQAVKEGLIEADTPSTKNEERPGSSSGY